eukprot:964908-Amphidinium_carterae.2
MVVRALAHFQTLTICRSACGILQEPETPHMKKSGNLLMSGFDLIQAKASCALLQQACGMTLALVDEFGRGTDPDSAQDH